VKHRRQGGREWRSSLASIAPLAFALALLAALLASALAQAGKPGAVDRSFGGDGKVEACGGYGGHFVPVAIDSHNRIVAGGDCLSRTLPSGRPDRAFNNAALSENPPPPGRSLAFDQGRIVTAGHNRPGNFTLRRYKGNGRADHSFNGASFGDPNASALSVAIDSHRRPVAVGYTKSSDADFALARFKWNGDLDPSFGSGGKVTTDFGTDSDYANSVAIDSRGRIVVGGGGARFELARYRPDGTLDPSFGAGGKVTTDFGASSRLNSIAIDARGRIVAGGAAANHDFALARYKPNGNLDRAFSNNGKVTGPLRVDAGAGFVGIDSRRRIVAVGCGGVNGFRLARYKPNGRLDRSFGRHGKVKTEFGRPNVWSAEIDSRDRIVVGASNVSVRLVRFIGYSGHR
jgi:uncharacterized delta-60 repeat protein